MSENGDKNGNGSVAGQVTRVVDSIKDRPSIAVLMFSLLVTVGALVILWQDDIRRGEAESRRLEATATIVDNLLDLVGECMLGKQIPEAP